VRVYALRLFTIQVSLPATVSIQSKPDINIFMTVKPTAFLHTGVVQLKQPDESHTPPPPVIVTNIKSVRTITYCTCLRVLAHSVASLKWGGGGYRKTQTEGIVWEVIQGVS
jgi:hypothetical protein